MIARRGLVSRLRATGSRGLAVAVLAALVAAPAPAGAQRPEASFLADVGYSAKAAETILTSSGAVSLEAFDGPMITGVYLHGILDGKKESVAYGIDGEGKRYSWFSVAQGDSVEHVAMLFDVDLDLTPDFLLFRTIDWGADEETLLEYRTPAIMDADIDIQVNSACAPPRCDPESWTRHPREVIEVPEEFFHPWREPWGVATVRGEPWLGKPRSLLVPDEAPAERPEEPDGAGETDGPDGTGEPVGTDGTGGSPEAAPEP